MSGLADISVCDGDPNIFISSQRSEPTYTKHGTILIRTPIGNDVLDWARSHNVLKTWAIPPLVENINLGLQRKQNRRAYYEKSLVLIPKGPIPGYVEEKQFVPDEQFIPDQKEEFDV